MWSLNLLSKKLEEKNAIFNLQSSLVLRILWKGDAVLGHFTKWSQIGFQSIETFTVCDYCNIVKFKMTWQTCVERLSIDKRKGHC